MIMTVLFSAVSSAEEILLTEKIPDFNDFNKTQEKTLKRLEKKSKNKCVKKVEKIFVKITKSSKTTPFFCENTTKKWGFFDVFAMKISKKKMKIFFLKIFLIT